MRLRVDEVKRANRRSHRASRNLHLNRPHVEVNARRARKRRRVFRFALFLTLALAVSAIVSGLYFYNHYSKIVDARLAAGLTSRAGIYAAPRVLRVSASVTRERLVEILRRADYVEREEMSDAWNGSFTVRDDVIEIHARRSDSSFAPTSVRVRFDAQDRIAELISDTNARLSSFRLEPEMLTGDRDVKTNSRAALSFADIPPTLVRAILSIEDRRFFDHAGVDYQAIFRALWTNVERERIEQGGSTITQQRYRRSRSAHRSSHTKRKLSAGSIAYRLAAATRKTKRFAHTTIEYNASRNGRARATNFDE